MKAVVSNIQRFSIHDGPGVRTVVFLKGCPLNCRWCHNPECIEKNRQILFNSSRCIRCNACVSVCPSACHSNSEEGMHNFNSKECVKCMRCTEVCLPKAIEICGTEMTSLEVINTVLRDKAFYGDDGGITISGGEPMAYPDFTIELLKQAKQNNITTCIETCGFFPFKYVDALGDVCDTILWDIKDTDYQRHIDNTGVKINTILNNLTQISAIYNKKIVIRCIILKGINDNAIHVNNVISLAKKLEISQINLIPFHPFGSSKYDALGLNVSSMGQEYIPTSDVMSILENIVGRFINKGGLKI